MRISATIYLDVISSWCFWAEPTWRELKRRYAGKVDFNWKIALLDDEALPKSRAQEEWFYRRSGIMNRAPRMLRTDWYEPRLTEYLPPNLMAEAARELGATDDSVRVALADATLGTGAPTIREFEASAEIAAKVSGLDRETLIKRAKSPEIEKRVRASTAEWRSFNVTQRPTFLFGTEIGDSAIFSGVVKLEPMVATIDSMLEDAAFYEAYAAHYGPPPPA